MRRKLFTLCSAMSLLLCMAAGVLWPVTWRRDDVQVDVLATPSTTFTLGSYRGVMYFNRRRTNWRPTNWAEVAADRVRKDAPPIPIPADYDQTGNADSASLKSWAKFGFFFGRHETVYRRRPVSPPYVITTHYFHIPHWFVIAAGAVLPAVALRRHYRLRRRRVHGLCRACGYDLRASPDLCPECGAEAKGAAA